MKAAGHPANETERLASLLSYDILDTRGEAAFEALTRLAAAILEVPIALVSLVDADRQWFKSRYGLEVSETRRELSFCGHVVESGASLVVADAVSDDRFADNPLVTGDPRIRFYAGMPLRTPDGFVLGTLCAIDTVPRQLTPTQLELLSLLAGQVVDQLEARRMRYSLAQEVASAREHAHRLEVLFDAMAEGVVVQDASGAITSANRAAEEILGLSVKQMQGRTSVHPDWHSIHEDGTGFPGETHPAMETLRTGVRSTNVVMGVHKPGGTLTWISINALPLVEPGAAMPHAVIATFHDITQLKEAQARSDLLARQERLVTTGTLAAGVGHEINNPLTFIITNLEYVLEEVRLASGGPSSARLGELVDVIADALGGAERIRTIVRGLRALATNDAPPVATDVGKTIELSINMAAHEIRHKATVTRAFTGTPWVMADESRLVQVLVNLLVNAAQAFPTSDTARNQIVVSCAREQDVVVIGVRDNGPGIPAAIQRRVFDPFFTTKPVGEGTGLGLSISQNIILALEGQLTVESTEGVGTTFRITLPVSVESGVPAPTPAPYRGRVLIVDDEPAILKTMQRLLGRDHDVVACDDSRKAATLLAEDPAFDIVLCDLMMPNVSGMALYEQLRARAPALAERFVFMTGGATEATARAFLANTSSEQMEKPFNIAHLRATVKRFVDAGSARR
jgi:PAS domain S-box-containing protein